MYPTSYNDEMEITRYFDFHFIDSTEFFAVENWEKKIENISSAGIVYAIVPQSESDIADIRKSILSIAEYFLCYLTSIPILKSLHLSIML